MFRFVLISIITLMQVYVFWRLLALPWFAAPARRKAALAFGVLMWLLFFYARAFKHSGLAPSAWLLELIGMDWLGFVFLCFTWLLAVDLLTGFGCFFRRQVPRLRAAALWVGIGCSFFAVWQGMRAPAVNDYQVELAGLPPALDGTVIAGLSDLHLGSLLGAKWLAARVAQVQAFRPDLIVLLGDTYDGRSFSAQEFVAELKGFSAPLGVWAVLGNHEHYRDREKHLVSFERAGIHVLSDQAVALRPGLVLAGVDDLTIRKRQGSAPAHLQKTLSGRPPGAAVLLSHSPLYEDEAARLGTGLMLSGHTHDGQLWPFNYLVMREYPVVSGVYKTGGLTLIVCRGTGTWGLRMRLWRRGEILRVTLRSPDAKNIKN